MLGWENKFKIIKINKFPNSFLKTNGKYLKPAGSQTPERPRY
jgi:hypothetical protein